MVTHTPMIPAILFNQKGSKSKDSMNNTVKLYLQNKERQKPKQDKEKRWVKQDQCVTNVFSQKKKQKIIPQVIGTN